MVFVKYFGNRLVTFIEQLPANEPTNSLCYNIGRLKGRQFLGFKCKRAIINPNGFFFLHVHHSIVEVNPVFLDTGLGDNQ
jgi:hypothetical protein